MFWVSGRWVKGSWEVESKRNVPWSRERFLLYEIHDDKQTLKASTWISSHNCTLLTGWCSTYLSPNQLLAPLWNTVLSPGELLTIGEWFCCCSRGQIAFRRVNLGTCWTGCTWPFWTWRHFLQNSTPSCTCSKSPSAFILNSSPKNWMDSIQSPCNTSRLPRPKYPLHIRNHPPCKTLGPGNWAPLQSRNTFLAVLPLVIKWNPTNTARPYGILSSTASSSDKWCFADEVPRLFVLNWRRSRGPCSIKRFDEAVWVVLSKG